MRLLRSSALVAALAGGALSNPVLGSFMARARTRPQN